MDHPENLMRLTPATELEYRCNKLQEHMLAESLDAVIIVQNADLFLFYRHRPERKPVCPLIWSATLHGS